ncbi:uroporphyrinogen-III synthase [Aliikangiella coralliicola]|uniref:Uroporphyrinogen-III synthase n=1 Tax=Aliikangiella coralliicola TaxID=2592383 RepID=A0A545UG03_9GAMM|nr:uroporphyrinogen-III synthase [Aliikangiella coralliicola]TQV88406.1 uroporphyrinogen-III synthase [Aliikangiella coralliicola]
MLKDSDIKRLIVTRPQGQTDSLLKKLKQAVGNWLEIEHLPLIQISPLDFSEQEKKDLTDKAIDGAIFISGNAARLFFNHSKRADNLSGIPLLAVGNNTASELKKITNQPVLYPDQMNSEGLLKLAQLQSISNQHWLIVKGTGGRSLIEQTLRERGAQVSEIEVYQRRLPDYSTQQKIYQQKFDHPVWLLSSAQAITHLHRILGLTDQPEHATRLIVSSDRLATMARQQGFTIIAQSAGASESQLVQCVKTLILHQE